MLIKNEDDLVRSDLYSWMMSRYYLPTKERYSFKGYEYLIELAKRPWKIGDQLFIRKSSQCGMSEWAIACLFWMNERKLKGWKGSGLIFPATQQLHDHLKARVFPLMEIDYFGRKLKNANLRFFRWNDYPINFRGGQTRRDLIGWPGDFIILDEFDEFANPISIVPTIEARQNASDFKWILGLSTPTYPDIGIDRAYSMSNQYNWYVNCLRCHKPFSPLIEIQMSSFEDCVVQAPITKEVGFKCPHCHDLTQTNGTPGQWVCDRKIDNQKSAYSISRLFVANTQPKALLDKFHDALNIQEFYNSDLGLPYAPSNSKITAGDVIEACIGESEPAKGSKEPTWMGVDVGLKCHYVIGRPKENGYVEVVHYGTCDWEELRSIEDRFNVKYEVIDLRPYEISVKKHIAGRRWAIACDFNTGNQEDWYKFMMVDDEARGAMRILKADRTQSCDHLINRFSVQKKIVLPSWTKGDMRFRNQMCAPTRMDESNPKTGDIKHIYNSGGKADHYFFAMVYLMLALETKRSYVATLGPKAW